MTSPSDCFDVIPDELKERPQWLMWDDDADTPRRPHWRGDFSVSWTDPGDWHTFDEAVSAAQERDSWGIGYVFAFGHDDYDGEYGAIDLDGCHKIDDEGRARPKDWLPSLEPFIQRGAYFDVSAGGDGLHIPIKGLKLPDWWSNQQITEKEHEGVEAYDKKFFTMTGNKEPLEKANIDVGTEVVEYGDWVDRWLREVYKSTTGDDPINQTADRDEYDEFLDESTIREALAYVDPDVGYPIWRDIGFALEDFFESKDTALSVFTNWSRSGVKWDSDAENQAERIIRDATSGGGRTIGTVIYHAKDGGWELPEIPDTSDSRTPIEEKDEGYHKFDGTDDDDNPQFRQITNFTIEVESRLTFPDGSRQYHMCVNPVDEDCYDVAVSPSVFNEIRTFKKEVLTGWGVRFDGNQRDLNDLREYLAERNAPERRGTEVIGIHGGELITPTGALTADGWTDNPETVFTGDNTPLKSGWTIGPETGDEYDRDEVRQILELLPQTRDIERFTPVIGWFYAAPLRPYIQEWEGEFNLLNVLGDTGAGKTATLEMMWQGFGFDGDLLRADGTVYPLMKAMTSSTLPIIFDEYKPADMTSYTLDKFHSYLRTSTRGGIEQKGNADMSVDEYHLQAPVCISGEQPIQGPAEERRTILTTFTRAATEPGSPESVAYTRLAGGEIDGIYYDGFNLQQHALAYYQWLLKLDTDKLREAWINARNIVTDLLTELELTGLDDIVVQGYVTVTFGCHLYQSFAHDMGAKQGDISITETDTKAAIRYLTGEGSGAEHRSHLSRLFDLMERAMADGYLVRGEHYTIVNERTDNVVLCVKFDRAFDKIRRYARDHDITGEDLLDTADDYRSRIRDAVDDEDSPVLDTSKVTRNLGRCIALDTGAIDWLNIDRFSFDLLASAGGGTYDRAFEATVVGVDSPPNWLAGTGMLEDDVGTTVNYEIQQGADPSDTLREGHTYRFKRVGVESNTAGVAKIEIKSGTTVTQVRPRNAGEQSKLQACSDGGESQEERFTQLVDLIAENDGVTIPALAEKLDRSPDAIRSDVQKFKNQGVIYKSSDGELRKA